MKLLTSLIVVLFLRIVQINSAERISNKTAIKYSTLDQKSGLIVYFFKGCNVINYSKLINDTENTFSNVTLNIEFKRHKLEVYTYKNTNFVNYLLKNLIIYLEGVYLYTFANFFKFKLISVT